MSNLQRFNCPYCHKRTQYEVIEEIYPVKMICYHCYKPVIQDKKSQPVKRRKETISRTAFLIHSSKSEDNYLLNWVRRVFRLYGVSTYIVEEDSRALDFLQKSKDGIEQTDFVVVLLTKRYKYKDDSGQWKWKGPDKCYDEIAMSYMRGKDMFALIEKGIDPGRVLERVAWYKIFRRVKKNVKIENGYELFQTLDTYIGNVKLPAVTYKL
jgi:hypothetical protein